MSSTGRSEVRNPMDYYVTPIYSINDFLREFDALELFSWKDKVVLDPSAGGDTHNLMSYPEALKSKCLEITTLDIRRDSLAEYKRDYLSVNLSGFFDVIITNPPYKLALEFIQKALKEVKDNGWVIMLLRLNFFGSQYRKEFWDKFMPQYSFVHSRRISFTNGATDSIEYMHCCWQKDNYDKFCKIKVI